MVAGEYHAGVFRIAGTGIGSSGTVPLQRLEPADEVPHCTSHRLGPGCRIQWAQVQPAHAGLTSNGLSSNLDELVIAGQSARSTGERVLSRCGHRRPTSFGRSGSKTRLTCGYQARAQCGTKLHNRWDRTLRYLGFEPAHHCGPSGSAPARAKPTRTYVHCKRMAMANSQ